MKFISYSMVCAAVLGMVAPVQADVSTPYVVKVEPGENVPRVIKNLRLAVNVSNNSDKLISYTHLDPITESTPMYKIAFLNPGDQRESLSGGLLYEDGSNFVTTTAGFYKLKLYRKEPYIAYIELIKLEPADALKVKAKETVLQTISYAWDNVLMVTVNGDDSVSISLENANKRLLYAKKYF